MADNSMQYWADGFPFGGVQDNTNGDGGTMQFWDNGFPYQFIFPPAAPGGSVGNFFPFFY